jgi:hypothetical protein
MAKSQKKNRRMLDKNILLRILKIFVACWLIVSIFGLVWMYELEQGLSQTNFETLYGYCYSRVGTLEYYDKFIFSPLVFTNGFRDYDPIQVYHVLLYSEIIAGLFAMVLLIIK